MKDASKRNKILMCFIILIFCLLFLTIKSVTSTLNINGISSEQISSICFISQGAPPQKTCDLANPQAIDEILTLFSNTKVICIPFLKGGGGIVRLNIDMTDGSSHSVQVYSSNFLSIDGIGSLVIYPFRFDECVLSYIKTCPNAWLQ